MAKTIAVQGSFHGQDTKWANIREIKSRAQLEGCENLTIWLSSDIRRSDAEEALTQIREKFPIFRGNLDFKEGEKGKADCVKLWREPNGTSLDVLLNLE